VQQIIATSVEIEKSLPDYEGDTDLDQINIHLGQFVEMTKIDLESVKKHANIKTGIYVFETNCKYCRHRSNLDNKANRVIATGLSEKIH